VSSACVEFEIAANVRIDGPRRSDLTASEQRFWAVLVSKFAGRTIILNASFSRLMVQKWPYPVRSGLVGVAMILVLLSRFD